MRSFTSVQDDNKNPMKNLQTAVNCLKSGEIIIYPTESCYALGVDAKNHLAVEKLKKVKNQPQDKPIHVICASLTQIKEIGVLNPITKKLSQKFHPGQLNLIIDFKKPKKYSYLSKEGIAFRIPGNLIARKLCQEFGSPITTTSANLHDEPPIYRIDEARRKFKNQVCKIIDTGDLDKSVPVSTIFDTRTKKIIREGLVTKSEISDFIK